MDNQTKPILILSDRDYQNNEINTAFFERGYSVFSLSFDGFTDDQLPLYPPKAIIIKAEQEGVGYDNT
ncbi:MAG: hypothetical protein JKX72_11380 [Robiginitomaculum sp.]|nr:hypothetical protein [Robiginitomaculum sp.]